MLACVHGIGLDDACPTCAAWADYVTAPDEEPWNRETVRAELDAKAAQLGIGSFRSRYPLSAEELFALVSEHLTRSERALCRVVLSNSEV